MAVKFNPSAMRFAICYQDDGRMKALACFCTIGLARETAEFMHKCMLRDSAVLTGKPIPDLFVYDQEGHCYGKF